MYTHRECINFKLMIEPNTLPNYSAKTHTKNTHIVLWSLSSESLRRAVFLRPLKEWYGVKLIQWYDLGYDSPRRGISDFICKRTKKAKAEGGGGCFSGPCLFVADSAPKTCRSFSPLCPLPTLSDIRSNKQTLQTTHFIWWHLFNVWKNDPAGNISYT